MDRLELVKEKLRSEYSNQDISSRFIESTKKEQEFYFKVDECIHTLLFKLYEDKYVIMGITQGENKHVNKFAMVSTLEDIVEYKNILVKVINNIPESVLTEREAFLAKQVEQISFAFLY